MNLKIKKDKKKMLTSAWLPEESVLLHFWHFKQGLCQSLPSDDTFSAENRVIVTINNLHTLYWAFPEIACTPPMWGNIWNSRGLIFKGVCSKISLRYWDYIRYLGAVTFSRSAFPLFSLINDSRYKWVYRVMI